MSHADGMFALLFWPFLACVSMGLLHGYAGLHVLRRGVIFVDLALAQMAALGSVVGLFFAAHAGALPDTASLTPVPRPQVATAVADPADELQQALEETGRVNSGVAAPTEEHTGQGFLDLWPTAFALGGAVLLAFSRMGSERVPHEAIIGVIYVVAAAITVLLLSKSPHGHEQMEEMLTGKLLFIDRGEVLTTGALYAGLGILHVLFFGRFDAISTSPEAAAKAGIHVRLWDTVFYAMFAVMVTRSVAVGGVLVVFSFLIIPGACAAMFVDSFKWRILIAWIIASGVSVLGMFVSAVWDLPSGSTIVATFGAALVACMALGAVLRLAASPESA